jgi:hypothetical protein
LGQANHRKNVQKDIENLLAQGEEGLKDLAEVTIEVPVRIDKMLKTLQEMKNGASPDETADYWEDRNKID